MATKNKGGNRTVITVDFTGVQTGGGALPSEGPHIVEIVEAEVKESSSGNDYINLKAKCTDDDSEPGRTIYHICSLQPKALFNLRGVLEAIGMEVPDGSYQFEPSDMIGGVAQVEVVHEMYEGKNRARVAQWAPITEDEDPAPAKTKAAAPKAAPAPAEAPAATKATKKGPSKAAEGGFAVGQIVSFNDDEGDEVTGKITALEGQTATVKVGKEEWEIEISELKAA